MKKIVIVEDKILRAISLAEQFVEFSKEHPELEIEVPDIYFFGKNHGILQDTIKETDTKGFNIISITLLEFIQTMSEYLSQKDTHLIFDFLLDDDGSEGVAEQRVNIRFARNQNRINTNRIWFYTATGTDNENKLQKLIGIEHMLWVSKVDVGYLKLNLNNEFFLNALKNDETGV